MPRSPQDKGKVVNQNQFKVWDCYGDEKPTDLLRWKELVSAKRTRAKKFSLGIAELNPGQAHLEHYHRAEFMVYFIIKGAGKAYLDGKAHSVSAGSVMYAPPTVRHKLVNTGRSALVFFWITDRARLESLSTVWTE